MASTASWEGVRDKFKKYREDQSRNSEEVVDLWENVLEDFSYKLDDEIWQIYEQVCIAACDCGRIDIAQKCIEALKHQFPDSHRVKRLKGLRCETMKRYADAEKLYSQILQEDETNVIARKRLVSLHKARNDIPEAIKELNKYLETHACDSEAWLELCDLYIHEQEYSKAAFCMEDLILSNPHNFLYHQRFAEIKYTQGGLENMELARAHFAQAVKISPKNVRSLYGFFMAASCIASAQRGKGKSQKDNMKYAQWAAEQISQVYKNSQVGVDSSQDETMIEGLMDALQITHSTSS